MSNRLAREQSPYLLQHKDNPVDWYPWGREAFSRSKEENKPIFLSIGYATCHWCHVMERESFENEGVAGFLNEHFVSIKVDREERPDVDDIYMTAVQTMTGSGGWPLSLFLTPQLKPFYGGTYFPPTDQYGRPGFLTLLRSIAQAWQDKPSELQSSSEQLLSHLRAAEHAWPDAEALGPETLETAAHSLAAQFDRRHGGFGSAPKFPPSMRTEFLIRSWLRSTEPSLREIVETTLSKMAAGGLYDQIGGGFHRYSVDAQWLVPHFEKMLYDNAMLARVYLLAHRAFGRPEFARIAAETLDYLLAEMTPEGGGFFAAQDADSDGREGTFYVWNPQNVEEALGKGDAPLVSARFGITKEGNFEGGDTVLSLVRSLTQLAKDFGLAEDEVASRLARARKTMYDARLRRPRPATDDKLLTDWTSLAISAFALGARVLRQPRYEKAARQAADRILQNCRQGAQLLHRERRGHTGIAGFASDYANFIEALLDLYEATFEPGYFQAAMELQAALDERFGDPRGGYFMATAQHDGLVLRPRESFDGATPSSNSVAAMNLLRLASFTGKGSYADAAERVFRASSGSLLRVPIAFPRLLCALDYRSDPPREIVLSGAPGAQDFESLRDAVFASRRLNRVVALADASKSLAELSPLVESREPKNGPALAYVCANFTCQQPVADPAELLAALDA